jgi:hypothetical protein
MVIRRFSRVSVDDPMAVTVAGGSSSSRPSRSSSADEAAGADLAIRPVSSGFGSVQAGRRLSGR